MDHSIDSAETVALNDVQRRCQLCANIRDENQHSIHYSCSPNQLLFFVLVWALKQKRWVASSPDHLIGTDEKSVHARIDAVASHLGAWGESVAALKNGGDKEWQLLRIQISKAIERAANRYQSGRRTHMKDDALGTSLMKVLELLHKIPRPRSIEAVDDVPGFARAQQSSLSNIYDFGSPLYPFARRLAHNELVTALRKETRHRHRRIDIGQIDLLEPHQDTIPDSAVDPEQVYLAARQSFKMALERLLTLVYDELTPKPSQVVLYSLAMRPQFWRAVNEVGAALPPDFPPSTLDGDDRTLGETLRITQNSIRVHRNHAKKRINELDPELGTLLARLMASY